MDEMIDALASALERRNLDAARQAGIRINNALAEGARLTDEQYERWFSLAEHLGVLQARNQPRR